MEVDTLKLMRGKSIEINKVGVLNPIIIDEIVDIGEKKYYKYLNNLCFDIDDLQTSKEEKQELIDKNITSYQIIISGCLNDINYLQLIIKAFKFFFKEDVCFLKQLGIFFLGNFNEHRFITSDNFEFIMIHRESRKIYYLFLFDKNSNQEFFIMKNDSIMKNKIYLLKFSQYFEIDSLKIHYIKNDRKNQSKEIIDRNNKDYQEKIKKYSMI
jgi:hypothetical protein